MTNKNHRNFPAEIKKDFELGVRSAWDILRDAFKNYSRNSDVNQAAAISFYAILYLIPFFLLTVLAASYFFGAYTDVQKDISENIKRIHPFFSEDIFAQLIQIVQIEKKRHLLGVIGIITLIWSSTIIFGALENALNIIFRAKTLRNIIESKLLAFAMIPFGWIVGVTGMGITYAATAAEKQTLQTGSSGLYYGYAFISRNLLPYLLTVAFIALIYMIIPKGKVTLWGALGGAFVFTTLLEAAKYFFTWYIGGSASYNLIFGSMETVVLLVIWVFYVSIIFLFCAEIISSYERRDLILLEDAFLLPKSKVLKTNERLFRKFGHFYPAGSYLFREDDSGNDMFLILNGRVCIEKNAGQVSKVLAEIGSGSYIGEMAALINAPRTASAYAMEDSYVAVIGSGIFQDVLRDSDGVSLFMLQEFSHRIKHTNEKLDELAQAWMKLLVGLYFLKEWPVPENKDPLTELAGITGKTTAEINEIFEWLGKEGILTIRDGRVTEFRKELIGDLLNSGIR
ncbi:MAG TPA: YhjD/YihY/BrkB family envelope integrity protein [Syntrophales bacterium]|nr:YhjD/YihY/BrkB family envelope integrity protein [Syntrophales bacterium]